MKHIIKVVCMVTLLVSAFTITAGASASGTKKVTVTENEVRKEYISAETTVSKFLEREEILVAKEDLVYVAFTKNEKEESEPVKYVKGERLELLDGTQIEIVRVKNIVLKIDGKVSKISTYDETVSDVLTGLPEKDGLTYLVDVKKTDLLVDGMQITVRSRQEVQEAKMVSIPFETEERLTDDLYIGESRVIQQGEEGILNVTIKDVYVSGEKVSTTTIGMEGIRETKAEIVEIGTKELVPTIKGYKYSKQMTMTASAYTAYRSGAKTATGATARVGIIAVDPKVIPLGTKLYIEGYGQAVAGDTGGSIKGNKVDLYFNTRNECINFGIQKVNVYVLID